MLVRGDVALLFSEGITDLITCHALSRILRRALSETNARWLRSHRGVQLNQVTGLTRQVLPRQATLQ